MALSLDASPTATSGFAIVSSQSDNMLHIYSLATGKLVRSIGGMGRFHISGGYGGLCVTSKGTLLLAERSNHRVQELTIPDGSWLRYVGEDVLQQPEFVACSATTIAVSERQPRACVTLFAADSGVLLTQFGGERAWQLKQPCGLRLMADGCIVVADNVIDNGRLVVFTTSGELVRSIPVSTPFDVAECTDGRGDVCFIASNISTHTLSKWSATGFGSMEVIGRRGVGAPASSSSKASGPGTIEFNRPTALAVFPSTRPWRPRTGSVSTGTSESSPSTVTGSASARQLHLAVLDTGNKRLQVLRLEV